MLRFVLRKMLNKRWMVLALLVGNILLVSITCSNAMYGHAVLQRTLTRSLADYMVEKNSYPGQVMLQAGGTYTKDTPVPRAAQIAREIPDGFDLPLVELVEHYFISATQAEDELQRDKAVPNSLALGCLVNLEEHMEIVAGEMYAPTPAEDGTIDVMVSERGMMEMNLILNERIRFPKISTESGEELIVRVSGVFRNSREEDPFWVRTPSSFQKECLMPVNLFNELFMENPTGVQALNGQFFILMDYEAMRGDQAERLYATALRYGEQCEEISSLSYRDNFSLILKNFLSTTRKVNVTLWVLQVPIFVLLAAFIFMVSRQMLDMEQGEIAVLKSRGASRAQIIMTYVLQSVAVALIALAAGVPLGVYLTQVLGSANAFMEFVRRSALPIEVTPQVLLFALLAALFSIAAMVLPVFRHSNTTIVNHKQKKHRRSEAPMWQRLFLDVAVLAVALYGLYNYNGQKELLAQRVMDGASLDPLLFISSSLFMIGAGLLALRVLPIITYIVFRLFRRWWSPALYAAFLQVIRTRYSQSFIMVFLVLTIALGIFNTQAARTINSNEEENIAYGVGAELVIQEKWEDNSLQIESGAASELVYTEPDFDIYRNMEGVRHITRVLDQSVSMNVPGGTLKDVQLMAIHTSTFGQTAWFKDGLWPYHFYDYLNAMASNARAVLLSRNFQATYGYHLGDAISYRNRDGDPVRGVVYGFVDYWPTYAPYSYVKGSDGVYKQTENYLIVANLAQVQAAWGITPYQIWMDVENSTDFMYDYAEENGIAFAKFEDTSAEIVALKNDPVFQGTNGILTVGFIVVLLLCAAGFLIYWILSIKARSLQFGIYRAMGMSMREIVTMLLGEQFFISATSIATGVVVGMLTSRLYMPLIQMAYAAYDSALPLTVVNDFDDMMRLMIIVGAMVLMCMAILGWLISRMKIAQALKLGED